MSPEEFKSYVLWWAKKMGVSDKVKSIHIRPMKRKIASCSSKGRLTFDPSVLRETEEKRDHIIVHELLHLTHRNHGKLFKCLLKAYISFKDRKLSE
ncbi:MAG: M48 family metallopeptidase [Candidatus Kryptonium sp.]